MSWVGLILTRLTIIVRTSFYRTNNSRLKVPSGVYSIKLFFFLSYIHLAENFPIYAKINGQNKEAGTGPFVKVWQNVTKGEMEFESMSRRRRFARF